MTSDVIQNKHAQETAGPLAQPLELTREQSFLDGTNDIFDILARQRHDQNTLQNNIGKTTSFLERAQMMLKEAEAKILEQDERLKTLEKLSWIDTLTGLLDMNGFSKAFMREVARTNRGHSDGGLIVMFNLENLETIKAQHSDEAADAALKLVAEALEGEIREMDLAARIKEDEFALLFTDTSMAKVLNRLQNMALQLNRLSMFWKGREIRISLSLGLKTYQQGSKAEQILKDANIDLQRNRKDAAHAKIA